MSLDAAAGSAASSSATTTTSSSSRAVMGAIYSTSCSTQRTPRWSCWSSTSTGPRTPRSTRPPTSGSVPAVCHWSISRTWRPIGASRKSATARWTCRGSLRQRRMAASAGTSWSTIDPACRRWRARAARCRTYAAWENSHQLSAISCQLVQDQRTRAGPQGHGARLARRVRGNRLIAVADCLRCFLGVLGYRERLTVAVAVVASVLAGLLTAAHAAAHASAVLTFAVSTVALGALAALVGQATEQVGGWLGPGATGVLQSALGNLPELFVGIFALQKGYIL